MHTLIRETRCEIRRQRNGRRAGESRPAVEVDNFESSFNLSHPPERLFLPSPPLPAPIRGRARARASLFFAPFISVFDRALGSCCGFARYDILLEFCHVRALRAKAERRRR